MRIEFPHNQISGINFHNLTYYSNINYWPFTAVDEFVLVMYGDPLYVVIYRDGCYFVSIS